MKKTVEANFDGIVGPTHNYSGLSLGNIASVANKERMANPREAALQGLKKMKLLMDLGMVQGVFPPHERPYIPLLRQLGYTGSDETIWEIVAKGSPKLLQAVSSAASMWTANAATITPSADSQDQRLHLTPANLITHLHRSIETATTRRILLAIFNDNKHFVHHPPLFSNNCFSDEGAANHTRFCKNYGEKGVHLFVWGKSTLSDKKETSTYFPARQTLEASQSLARQHHLPTQQVVYAQQNPAAIEAGVFHNDVISLGNQQIFLFHEDAFVSQKEVLEELKKKIHQTCQTELTAIPILRDEVALKDAVSSYLFNSQLITDESGRVILIAPKECEKIASTRLWLEKFTKSSSSPIQDIRYVDLRESMQNGGGPACLRLRVVLTEQERQAMNPGVLLTEDLYRCLNEWVLKHYRDSLYPQDLADPRLIRETREALDELTKILNLGSIYEFQL